MELEARDATVGPSRALKYSACYHRVYWREYATPRTLEGIRNGTWRLLTAEDAGERPRKHWRAVRMDHAEHGCGETSMPWTSGAR